MVTRAQKYQRDHLYITEWRERRGLSVEGLAEKLSVSRETVWRWETQQHRLNPPKIAAIAAALNIEPGQLYHHPDRPSIDAMLDDKPDELARTAYDIIQRLAQTG
jgi:transcriptional regulator with XRE-family HTH domain